MDSTTGERQATMTTMHHHHMHRPSPLEIKQLAEFDALLGDIPEDERRRKRVVYLSDAIARMRTGTAMLKGFGCLLIPFAIIPIFWPVLIFAWFIRKKSLGLMDSQLDSALDYWNIRKDEVVEDAPEDDRRTY